MKSCHHRPFLHKSQQYSHIFYYSGENRFYYLVWTNFPLKVYDFMGREVKTLVDAEMVAGEHHMTFDARNLPSGVYFYRLQANGMTETKKIAVVK